MQGSDEVRATIVQFFERMSAGDVEGTAATISDDPEAFVIGTQRVGGGRDSWLASVQENASMGLVFEPGATRAWREGDFGWAVDEPSIVLPDGTRLRMRMTAVLRRDAAGHFRIVHQHYSWAVPDEVAIERAQAWLEQLSAVAK